MQALELDERARFGARLSYFLFFNLRRAIEHLSVSVKLLGTIGGS